ncbi:dermonecrotic toxin domain-containing protein [Pseudomonas trivialis]|uniref:dermonecrotic toxin domain-containing protein n=1 Tax=Pseudomonas trivialis TaxID=200450 RepID=UPI003BAF2EEE
MIQNALPNWVRQATPARIQALKRNSLPNLAPYPNATPEQHRQLNSAVAAHWHAQAPLDKRLGALNDLRAFAERQLKRALLPDYGEIDVRNTWLRVYVDAPKAWWVIDIKGGIQSKTVSLLDMSLHNFAASDTFVDHAFLGSEDARGQREILSIRHLRNGQNLTVEGFKSVCRTLDIGGNYQARLRSALGFDQPALSSVVRQEVLSQLKADLRSSAHLALQHTHLPSDAHQALLGLIDHPVGLSLNGRPLACYTLKVGGIQLAGIMVFATSPEPHSSAGRVIAWVPQDPEHPLKQYPSPQAFAEALTDQLRSGSAYQVFFSQFVAHAERGAFFSKVTSGTNLVFSLLDINLDHPNRAARPEQDTPWLYLYRVKLNKIVNDARELAVSSAYADRLARWAWWDNVEQIVSDVLNAALLVATPFVPVLGQMMLVCSVYQVCNDVFEGLLDWAQGHGAQAVDHLLGVTDAVAQFALFGAAGKAFEALKLSSFVEGLHPVQTSEGKVKLWNPDLSPYAQSPADVPAENALTPLQDQHFEVRHDAELDEHRIVHPSRPDAYRPRILFNGDGAFMHEGEQPQSWDNQTLMRRLGPRVKDFTDQQLADLRVTSGTHEGVLRAMYCNNERMPTLLAGSLERLEARAFPEAISRRVRTGDALPDGPSMDWFPQHITELPGWPESKALKVYLNDDLTGPALTHGNQKATQAETLNLSLSQALSGTLPEHVLAFLDEADVRSLLKGNFAKEFRVQILREKLANHVLSHTADIADTVYRIRDITDDPSLATLREPFKHLDSNTARAVHASATAEEKQALAQRQLPLRLHNRARELAFANQSVLAFEGLDRPSPLPTATERMALNALKFYSDTFGQLRIEIRENSATGPLRCAAGPSTGSTTRVLIRNAQGYEVHEPGSAPRTDLYQAILLALPADQREALGVKPGDGAALKQWIKQHVESLAERRVVLAEAPVPVIQSRETSELLGGPVYSRCTNAQPWTNPEHARMTLQLLFPQMSEARLNVFLDEIPPFDLRNTLNRLTEEKQQLHVDLYNWKKSSINTHSYPLSDRQIRHSRKHLARRLERCWGDRFAEYTDSWGHVQRGAVLNLDGITMPPELPVLSANFDHVTVLTSNNCGFNLAHSDFLKLFPSLRGLSLADNGLTRVPEALQQMHFLRDLKLSGNRLELSGEDAATLNTLRHLKSLDLNNNPLIQIPDIGGMPGLRRLYLANTPIDTWPAGLFAQPRNEDFILDLHGTRIERLPQVQAGSLQARIVARARLDRATLIDEDRVRYEALREAAGLDPNRTYEPQGTNDFWLQGLETDERKKAGELWGALEKEHGSQGFFEVIAGLKIDDVFQTGADRQRFITNTPLLRQQVWRVLRAAHADTPLREHLFKMSSFPGLCPDAATQIFNEMGIEVMASEIMRDTASATELESRLVTLAKGSARFKLLARVVGEDIATRLLPKSEGGLGQRFSSDIREGVPGEIDEVDVHLAYQTSLAGRLDLPWINDHMLYRLTANVSSSQIDHAYTRVFEQAEGDGLVNQMLLHPWWEQHLQAAYENQYRDNDREYNERFLALDDLKEIQPQWANADALPTPEHERLRETLKDLADAAHVPESEVFTEQAMDTERYNRLLNNQGYDRQEWMRRLTRRALTQASGRSNRSR